MLSSLSCNEISISAIRDISESCRTRLTVCRINGHISFLKIYGKRTADTVAVIEDILSKIIEIENQLSDNRQIYDKLKNEYINYGSGKELEL